MEKLPTVLIFPYMSPVGSHPPLTSEFTLILHKMHQALYLYPLYIVTYHLAVYVWEEQMRGVLYFPILVSIFHLNFITN